MGDDKIHVVFDIDMTLVLSTDCEFDEVTRRAVSCDESRPPAASSPRRRPARATTFRADHFDLPDFGMRVNLRPFAVELMSEVMRHPGLTVSVWSAGEKPYVHAVARELARRAGGRFEIVWSRDRCAIDANGEHFKPLTKLAASAEGRALGMAADASNVVLVDDLDLNFEANRGKVYLIQPYDRVNRFDYALRQFAYKLFMTLGEFDLTPVVDRALPPL